MGKCKVLGIIDEGVNNETRILLQYWDFRGKMSMRQGALLVLVAWDSFEFDKASSVSGYSFPNPCAFYARSYYAPLWCDLRNSSDHNFSSCPYYACYAHPDSSLPLA